MSKPQYQPSLRMLKDSLPRVFKASEDNAFADLLAALDHPSARDNASRANLAMR